MSFVSINENFWELQLKWSLLFFITFFLKICTGVLNNNINKSVCGKVVEISFLHALRNQVFRFFIITTKQNKTKEVFGHTLHILQI